MKYQKLTILLTFIFVFFCLSMTSYAETKKVKLTTAVFIRKGAGTTYDSYVLGSKNATYTLKSNSIIPDEPKNGECDGGWYKIDYSGKDGYICAKYADVISSSTAVESDEYLRPWTTPKASIVGGAKYISKYYISKGQFTSYLKKFNVNPDSYYKVYNHQYMANLAAPYSEAYTTYKSYRDNNLLKLALEFTIPIYDNMPDYTTLPGSSTNKTCQSKITDSSFEKLLDAEGFPESYKCKLRLLHNDYPNWKFYALDTGLDFNAAVKAEKKVSSIQGGTKYYDYSTGSAVQTEKGWYVANDETVAFYLDPRNFLGVERVLMFEDLAYSANYTESVIQSILKGTFMEGKSALDNQAYAKIFVEAGKTANISAVYLASLAKQEAGTKLTNTTNGAEFTYNGITYSGLYNFYNIGAYSSEKNPALAGLVWASGGSDSVIVSGSTSSSSNSAPVSSEETILKKLEATTENECLTNIKMGTTLSDIKTKLSGYTVSIKGASNTDVVKTGQIISISDGTNTYSYTLAISGDVDGDGKTGATDYVKIKNYIMEKKNSDLNTAQNFAADVDNNGAIGATDYVKIKNSLME